MRVNHALRVGPWTEQAKKIPGDPGIFAIAGERLQRLDVRGLRPFKIV